MKRNLSAIFPNGCTKEQRDKLIDEIVDTYEHGTETVDDSDVADYFEYYNRDTLSMSFDGDIYDVFNYDLFPSLLEKFDKLLESYGLYYELGNAWNLALYEI